MDGRAGTLLVTAAPVLRPDPAHQTYFLITDVIFFSLNFFGFLMVLVLLTAHAKRFSVSRMRDFPQLVGELWYKQWKVCRGCLEKFALGNSESHQTFPRCAAPRESLMTRVNSRVQIFQTIPEDFPRFFRLSD